MPSLIHGFEYDVFISYRHKDNKYDGWVTEFVANLRKELEATFKEDVSVYFDENPHDGLLETHQVDDSLKSKLKCLVFIPIISQTYCDPKSFAWKNEFIAFRNSASSDPLGLKVKLGNGNVASRILPIRIHDLDTADRQLLELEFGGYMRGIDFIYKSAGVNRPLRVTEEEPNESHTVYRNQINKVANAIKEIIQAVREPQSDVSLSEENQTKLKPKTAGKRGALYVIGILVFLLTASAFALYFSKVNGEQSSPDKSIAVLAFVDLSRDHDQAYLGDGLAEAIITSLSSVEGLRVVGRTSSFQFKGEKIDAKRIGQQLNVTTILEGSVQKVNNRLRITTQLIDVANNSQLWSQQYDREMDDIFEIQDNISANIISNLRVKLFGNSIDPPTTRNAEAYDLYLKGVYEFRTYSAEGVQRSIEYLSKAITLDTTFANAYSGMAWSQLAQASIFSSTKTGLEAAELAKPFVDKALALNPRLGEARVILGFYFLYRHWDFQEAEKQYKLAIEQDPTNPDAYAVYADFLNFTRRHEEALKVAEKQVAIEPYYPNSRNALCLFYLGQHQAAKEFQKQRLAVFSSYWNYDADGFVKLNSGDYAGAIRSFTLAIEGLKIRPPRMLGWTGAAYARSGNIAQARKLLKELQDRKTNAGSTNFFIAVIHVALGEHEAAIKALQKAYREHDWELPWLISEPQLFPLHDDPRFKELVEKIGFPKY